MTERALMPLLAALALAPSPARAVGHAELHQRLGEAIRLLQEESVEEARAVVEPLRKEDPDDPGVQLVTGALRFLEQRYAEAVPLLEAGERASPDLAGEYLALARNARDVTKGYVRAEGEHFVVSTARGKDEVLVPYVVEALEAQRRALQKDLGYAPPGKVTVEFLDGSRSLARLSTLGEDEIKTSGTIAICKFNKLMIISPRALLRGYEWLDTAAHEYTHYVVTRRTHNRAPIWLHEGIAKWEETRWRGAGGEALSPFAAALLKDSARRGRLITFAEMHPSMAKLPSQEAAALAFAEVAVAVEYLQKQGGQPLMNRILDEVQGGLGAEEALAAATGAPFADFLAGWKRWIAARPLPQGGDTELQRLRFKGDPKHGGTHSEWAEIPDERARAWARLGEIFRERGRWEAARQEYAKAVKRVGNARHPVLADKFALASMMAGRDGDAETALMEATRNHPHYAALHVHLGRLELRHRQWANARDAFLQANRVDPFDPEIHAGLAEALSALGDGPGASREKRFAEILLGRPE